VRFIADTNILLRITLGDDPDQAHIAQDALRQATLLTISLPTFCEFAWVLAQGYKQKPSQIALAIEEFLQIGIVETDRTSVEAGLALLKAGGDFADGVIAFEGRRAGGEIFLTFDKQAARLLARSGMETRLLSNRA
jgi:predicted nucleic-acid-binding protein